ncbi:MAG TPA: hypothetical protein VFB29_17490 [Pseudolabrys sp.]|nr:hypothetical protein [Pseudolabrys sp.]
MPSRDIEPILSRFPGPVQLFPSRKKWLLVLLISGVLTLGGVLMVKDHAPWGWPALIFFGLCTVLSAVMLLPGAARLKLDADGFQVTAFFRGRRWRWQDVKKFEAVSVTPQHRMVCFDDPAQKGSMLGKISQSYAGHNSALPDTYGFPADDLAQLITQWRNHAQRQG